MPKFTFVAAALAGIEAGHTEIRLGNKGLTAEDVRPLLEVLKTNSSVTLLWLDRNNLGDDGASLIADMLRENSTLQLIYLGSNEIGDTGAEALASSLKQNKSPSLKQNGSLQWLDLSYNKIGDVGVEALAGMLGVNQSLQALFLNGGNTCTAKGGEALAFALESNEALKYLSLPDGIPDDIETRIEARVKVAEQQFDDFGAKGVELLQSNAKVRWGHSKLMVVGKGAAGKSSTIRTLLGQDPVETHDSTIGVDLKLTRTRDWAEREAGVGDLDEQLAKAQFLTGADVKADTADAEADTADSEAHTADLDKQLAKAQLQSPRDSLARRVSRRLSMRKSNSASKTSALAVQVKEKDVAKSYRADLKARVQQDGGKTVTEEVSFTIWDYGGQEVFYSLHHLFLTSYGIYVLAFDMRELLGRERFKDSLSAEAYDLLDSVEGALATLRFWLDSTALHAPDADIVLVGTYMDAVSSDEDLKAVDGQLKSLDVHTSEHTERNRFDRLWFFPVDNMDRSDAALERAQILRDVVVGRVRDKDFVKREVPLRWALLLERMLADTGRNKGRNYMELDDVKKLALDVCGIEADEVTDEMLPFLHGLGVVVHLTATPTLANIVVTRPQWLLDNLSRVICDPQHMETHVEALLDAAEPPRSLRKHLERWGHEGIATRALQEWLWQGPNVDYFVDLMQEMLLGSPVDATSGDLLVPSLLAAASPDVLRDATASFADGPLAYVQFAFLPKGVFQRFVTSLAIVGPEIVHIRNVCADLALVTVNKTNVLLAPDAASKRVLIRFMPEAAQSPKLGYRVMLIMELFSRINVAFMKTSLHPSLVLSSDGTEADDACATFVEVSAEAAKSKTAGTNDPVLALSRKALCVADFDVFLAAPQAASSANAGVGAAGAKVFVSYRRTHIFLALWMQLSLVNLGYDVFLDILPETSALGDFQERLEGNLCTADFVIALLTPSPSGPDPRRKALSSLASVKDAARSGTMDWCYRELQLAMKAYRKGEQMVIPVWRDIDLRADMRDLPSDIADLEALEGIELKDDRMFGEYVQLLHTLMQKHLAKRSEAN